MPDLLSERDTQIREYFEKIETEKNMTDTVMR